ncbi:hypothetical protein [Nonomuraea longicatena]|uniref:Uncharacterized protein n=1 Tax=Nonomuraea longicatena TaxID=83682 RepID=A0ABN1NSE3_9ACTN
MTSSRRRIAITVAALSLAGFATGCGAIGQAVDCTQVATDITTISNDYTKAMGAVGTDMDAFNKAGEDAAAKAKELAGKYDGELKTALNDLAATFESMKMDKDNPAAAMDGVTKLPEFVDKVQKACG